MSAHPVAVSICSAAGFVVGYQTRCTECGWYAPTLCATKAEALTVPCPRKERS